MGFFDFFTRQKSLKPYGWDIHSHLIPGIDDGSNDVNESMEMIRSLVKIGFTHFICTPHIMSDFYKNDRQTITTAFNKLIDAIQIEKLDIHIEFAAEYYLDEGFVDKLENDDLLTFGDNYLLFETSYMNKPSNLKDVIFKMITKGYKPILAHPERYTYMFDDFYKYEDLYNTGVLFQINTNSLTGYYSKKSMKIAQKLIDTNMIDFLGSDCHKPKHVSVMKQAMSTKHYLRALTKNLKNNTF